MNDINNPHRDVNNHVHSAYSFSPYSPEEIVQKAYEAGLCAVGLIDHDTVAGAHEFIKAGELIGIGTTVGMECRADFSETKLAGRRINNTDQVSIAYVVLHGIPHSELQRVTDFMKPYNYQRNERNKKMVDKLNKLLAPHAISVNYDEEVIPLSFYKRGGTITERHLLFALSNKLINHFGAGDRLIGFLEYELRLKLQKQSEDLLKDLTNPYYAYNLLGILKSEFLPEIYINAQEECPKIGDLGAFAQNIGAILAYPYLGDVGESVTNDKRSQTFEDDYIDLLFDEIKRLGFHAVTYMPSRNTSQQLQNVMALCYKYNLMQISGEDINSPKQSFICLKQRESEFAHLYDSTWALIGHELVSSKNLASGMFSFETLLKHPDLSERIELYKNLGLTLFKKSY